ncbi:MAG: anthranilate phosphoribosyltransferase [Cytophagales bacterium]|nr:anthranilate phosphoribosyltransferase [Cytophagales bacterium]
MPHVEGKTLRLIKGSQIVVNRLFQHQSLTKFEAKGMLMQIGQGMHNPAQIASFLTVYLVRSITLEELEGFREAMLELCTFVDLKEFDPIDLCGTGGDGKDTFNISTLSTFVAAGAGVKVAKHGNYAISSASGSSNVLEYLGYTFTNDPDKLRRSMEQAGVCFLHAPMFHPAMKNIAPIRRELGVKTFFNILGPMVNPAFPGKQLVGVYSLELARLYAYLYQKLDKRFIILHSLDGYDEISLTGPFKLFSDKREQLLVPSDLKLNQWLAHELKGGSTTEEAGKLFVQIIEGHGTKAQNEAVIANAGMAIHCAKPQMDLLDCMEAARESLLSGKALITLKKLVNP